MQSRKLQQCAVSECLGCRRVRLTPATVLCSMLATRYPTWHFEAPRLAQRGGGYFFGCVCPICSIAPTMNRSL